nr:hypothetical protein [Prochloraceae cyanobacterium]
EYSPPEVDLILEASGIYQSGGATMEQIATIYGGSIAVGSPPEKPAQEETAPTATNLDEELLSSIAILSYAQGEKIKQMLPRATLARVKQLVESGQMKQEYLKVWQEALGEGKSKEEEMQTIEAHWTSCENTYKLIQQSPSPLNWLKSSKESSNSNYDSQS